MTMSSALSLMSPRVSCMFPSPARGILRPTSVLQPLSQPQQQLRSLSTLVYHRRWPRHRHHQCARSQQATDSNVYLSRIVGSISSGGSGLGPRSSWKREHARFLSAGPSSKSSQPSQPQSSSGSSASTTSSASSSNWVSNLLINVGWTLLGLVAIDQLLQYKQQREMEEHRMIVNQMQREANLDSMNANPWMMNSSKRDGGKDYTDPTVTPAMFRCKIRHVEKMLDGTKMLPLDGLQVGSVVDVLEENVGPNHAYHLCRLNATKDNPKNTSQIGWYPVDFLERVA